MRPTTALIAAASGEGRDRLALTHDGRALGGYTRPSLARSGKRLAFKLGDPGRVWTAKVKRRRGRIVGLGRRTRIEAFRDGRRDATQFDVAIPPRGKRAAWVEIFANPYSAPDIDHSIERPGVVALLNATSAAPVRDLTAGPNDLYPSVAPSARAVAFQRSGAVWTVPTGGGNANRLLRRARQPTWSR